MPAADTSPAGPSSWWCAAWDRCRTSNKIPYIVLTSREGVPVLVRDVADVVIGHTIRQGAVSKDGEGEIVTGIVMMRVGENARTVIAGVKERFEAAKATLPEGVQLESFDDRTELIERTIGTVYVLLEGAVLVLVILFMLLGNVRAALIVALAIPLSMLFAFSAMVQAGIAGSLMSLGAIDFGLVVDGSVVMVENAMRHLGEPDHDKRDSWRASGRRAPRWHARSSSASASSSWSTSRFCCCRVWRASCSAHGTDGRVRPHLIPGAHLRADTGADLFGLRGRIEEKDVWLMRRAKALYAPTLEWTLRHGRRVVIGSALAVAAAVATFPFLGSEFIPRLDEQEFLRLSGDASAQCVARGIRPPPSWKRGC